MTSIYTKLSDIFNAKNQIIQTILMIFTIIDIIATFIIGLFALLAPNLHVLAFKKEPTFVMLCIIIGFMISLPIISYMKKPIQIFIKFIVGFLITFIIFYSFYMFFQWYFLNIEGTFNFRFLTLIKKSTIEEKTLLFNTTAIHIIERLALDNLDLATYLKMSPSITNPSTVKLASITYEYVPKYVEEVITIEIQKYSVLMETMKQKANLAKHTNTWYYTKWAIGVTVGLGATIFIINHFNLVSIVKKSIGYLADTQTEVIALANQSKADSLLHVHTNQSIAQLSSLIQGILTNIEFLSQKIDFLNNNVNSLNARTSHIVNQTIRPSMQALYIAIKNIHPQLHKTIIQTLSEEQRDFINTVSKLIFKT